MGPKRLGKVRQRQGEETQAICTPEVSDLHLKVKDIALKIFTEFCLQLIVYEPERVLLGHIFPLVSLPFTS